MGSYCKNVYKCLKENIYLYFTLSVFFIDDKLPFDLKVGLYTDLLKGALCMTSSFCCWLLSIDSEHRAALTVVAFFDLFTPIYMVYLTKKAPLCFCPRLHATVGHCWLSTQISLFPAQQETEPAAARFRDFAANDRFGRLFRSITANDDWPRCNKSRVFENLIWTCGVVAVQESLDIFGIWIFSPPTPSPYPCTGLMIFWLEFFQHPAPRDFWWD